MVLTRKRVLCLCYALLHERVFIHYFHFSQITSLQHLIRVSFMWQLNQLKIQSTLHNFGDTYLKRFQVNGFQLPQKQRSKLQGIKKVITATNVIIIILLVIVIFIIIGTVIIIIIIRYCYYRYCYLLY